MNARRLSGTTPRTTTSPCLPKEGLAGGKKPAKNTANRALWCG